MNLHDDKNVFIEMIAEVREVRKPYVTCLSAQDGVNLNELLQKIVSEDYYKSDYNDITQMLLFEQVTYSDVIKTMQQIIADGCFA